MTGPTVIRRTAELLGAHREFVLAHLVSVTGSVPQQVGAKMIVFADRTTEFTIGGGPFEAKVTEAAAALLRSGAGPELKEYTLSQGDLGMYCAGKATVLLEVFRPDWRLLVFGGGHVGRALARMAVETGVFETWVIDDRAEFAAPAAHPTAAAVVHTDREYRRGVPEPDARTLVVIVTRCHEVDRRLLGRFARISGPEAALPYVGMIGSRAKVTRMRAELAAEGLPAAALDRVHMPIGLPVGGKNPGEIAVSILAQLLQVKQALVERAEQTGETPSRAAP